MTKEDELKKQAETEYRKQEERCKHSWNGAVFQFGYLAGAEPREKQITDLEAQIEKMKCGGNCKHLYHVNTGGCYDAKCDLTYCDCTNCKDKWELRK